MGSNLHRMSGVIDDGLWALRLYKAGKVARVTIWSDGSGPELSAGMCVFEEVRDVFPADGSSVATGADSQEE